MGAALSRKESTRQMLSDRGGIEKMISEAEGLQHVGQEVFVCIHGMYMLVKEASGLLGWDC